MYIALLRAVNVGGTGKLSMVELTRLCVEAVGKVKTYIASGDKRDTVKSTLARRLSDHTGKTVDVFLRTSTEMRAVLRANPFPKAEPARSYVFFLAGKPPRDTLRNVRHQKDEDIRVGKREVYVYYPSGMGQSKLIIPAGNSGTARNMNTVAKLVEMTA